MNVGSPETWLQLLHWDPALKLAPAVVSTLALMLVMSRFKSPWALPAILVVIPGIFFVVLLAMHKSLADAQDSGWVSRPQVSITSVCHSMAVSFVTYELSDLQAMWHASSKPAHHATAQAKFSFHPFYFCRPGTCLLCICF